jgi:hypothetical protein
MLPCVALRGFYHDAQPVVSGLLKDGFPLPDARTGRGFFAEERNLNLMTAPALSRVASGNYDFTHEVSRVALCGWPSNLLLNMRRVSRNHSKLLSMRSKHLSTIMAGRDPHVTRGTPNLD